MSFSNGGNITSSRENVKTKISPIKTRNPCKERRYFPSYDSEVSSLSRMLFEH